MRISKGSASDNIGGNDHFRVDPVTELWQAAISSPEIDHAANIVDQEIEALLRIGKTLREARKAILGFDPEGILDLKQDQKRRALEAGPVLNYKGEQIPWETIFAEIDQEYPSPESDLS